MTVLVLTLSLLLFVPLASALTPESIMTITSRMDRCTALMVTAKTPDDLAWNLRLASRPIVVAIHDPKHLCKQRELLRIELNGEPLLVVMPEWRDH